MSLMHSPLVVIPLLVVLLGFFSMAESALSTARRWRLREKAARGERGAAAGLRLTENLERSVSSVRLGITLAATTAGFYAGASLGQLLKHDPSGRHADLTQSETVVIGAVFLGFALTIFVLGELVPRQIALHRSEQVIAWLARPLEIFSLLSSPLVRALGAPTDLLIRLLGARPLARPAITQEEIKGLLWEGTRAGLFDEAEHEIFKRVFRFCDRRARALMTPRNKVDLDRSLRSSRGNPPQGGPITSLALSGLRREPR